MKVTDIFGEEIIPHLKEQDAEALHINHAPTMNVEKFSHSDLLDILEDEALLQELTRQEQFISADAEDPDADLLESEDVNSAQYPTADGDDGER